MLSEVLMHAAGSMGHFAEANRVLPRNQTNWNKILNSRRKGKVVLFVKHELWLLKVDKTRTCSFA